MSHHAWCGENVLQTAVGRPAHSQSAERAPPPLHTQSDWIIPLQLIHLPR